jgi:hypothetical protein
MKKALIVVTLVTAMNTASAGFFGNNYSWSDNGVFGFNPYSFMEPRWFIQEAGNFVDEFDNTSKYRGSYHDFPVSASVIPYNYSKAEKSNYFSDYMAGYSNYYK